MWCSIRKLAHNRSRKEKQRAITQIVTSRIYAVTSLAFHSASETKHKRGKYCGQHLLYQLFPMSLILNPLSKLYAQHMLTNQKRKVLPTCSQNHDAIKWRRLGSFFRVSSRMPKFFPLYTVSITTGSHSFGNNPRL